MSSYPKHKVIFFIWPYYSWPTFDICPSLQDIPFFTLDYLTTTSTVSTSTTPTTTTTRTTRRTTRWNPWVTTTQSTGFPTFNPDPQPVNVTTPAGASSLFHIYSESSHFLTLNAPIATKVVCFSRLLKCLRGLYGKQCGPRSDCSYWSILLLVHAVCFYT